MTKNKGYSKLILISAYLLVVPFYILSLLYVFFPSNGHYLFRIIYYGCFYISFVSGCHWAFLTVRAPMLGKGLTHILLANSFIAFCSILNAIFLYFIGFIGATVFLSLLFICLFWLDLRLAKRIKLPDFYIITRLRMTYLIILSFLPMWVFFLSQMFS